MRFVGRTVVITGSSRNIGLTVARRFAQEGANIVINAATSADELTAAEEILRTEGAHVCAVLADLSSPEGAGLLISRTIQAFGALDTLVLNHSTRPHSPFLKITEDEWRSVIDVNLTASFMLCQAAIPHLLKSDLPSIIAVGGYSRGMSGPNKAHASAASGARTAMLESISAEFAPQGLRVNFVAIGAVDTVRKHPEWYPDAQSVDFLARVPMGRLGTTDEIASVVLFLASSEASFVANATVRISGGAPT